jgi:hypothetical protein
MTGRVLRELTPAGCSPPIVFPLSLGAGTPGCAVWYAERPKLPGWSNSATGDAGEDFVTARRLSCWMGFCWATASTSAGSAPSATNEASRLWRLRRMFSALGLQNSGMVRESKKKEQG